VLSGYEYPRNELPRNSHPRMKRPKMGFKSLFNDRIADGRLNGLFSLPHFSVSYREDVRSESGSVKMFAPTRTLGVLSPGRR